jgi:hypothetical protein
LPGNLFISGRSLLYYFFSTRIVFQGTEDFMSSYLQLREDIRSNLHVIQENHGSVKRLGPLIKTLRVATRPDDDGGLNAAHIALNLRHISGSTTALKSELRTIDASLVQAVEQWLESSEKVEKQAEKALTESEISMEASELYMAANECQVISNELRLMAVGLQSAYDYEKEDSELAAKLINISESVKAMVTNFVCRLPGHIKYCGAELLKAVGKLPTEILERGRALALKIAPILKNVLEKFQLFMTGLVGAMVNFAAWVQGISTRKGFRIQNYSIEFPSMTVEIITVGTLPLSISRLETPKMSLSFASASIAI